MLLVFYLILILLIFYPSYKILSKLIAKRSQEGSVGLMSKMEAVQMDKMCQATAWHHLIIQIYLLDYALIYCK